MKATRFITGRKLAVVLLLAASTTSAAFAQTSVQIAADDVFVSDATWKVFSGQIVRALHSGHPGLQEGALRMVILYGEAVNVQSARNDIVAIYRNSKNQNLRRMAVVALGAMHDRTGLSFLRRCLDYEKNQAVRYTMATVLTDEGLAYLRQMELPDSIAIK